MLDIDVGEPPGKRKAESGERRVESGRTETKSRGIRPPALDKGTSGLRAFGSVRRRLRALPGLLQRLHLLLYGHRIFLKHLLLLRRER